MIPVTRMNNQRIHLNPDLLEAVEESGDTVLVLSNGNRLVVRESAEEIVQRMLDYRTKLLSAVRCCESAPDQQLHAASSRSGTAAVRVEKV